MNTFLNPDDVARCAYLIWEGEGRPVGREHEHWYQAEAQLLVTRAHDHWLTAKPSQQAAA